MSAAWLLQALLAGVLLSVGAAGADRVAGWMAWPRRWIWAAAMTGSLLLAGLPLLLPGLLPDLGILPDRGGIAMTLDDLPLGEVVVPTAPGPGPMVIATSVSVASVLGLVWTALSAAMLGVVLLTVRRLHRLRASSRALEVCGVPCRLSEGVGPAVVGLLRPEVVLPRWTLELSEEERRLILAHEREHIAARDVWLLFLSTLALAALPWSPPLWWQHRRLRLAVETDCDARVLARGASRRDYGRVLLRAAASPPALSLLSPAWGESTSHLERRIMTMTARRPTHRLLRSLSLLGLSMGVVATACDVAGRGGRPSDPSLATGPEAAPANRALEHEDERLVNGQLVDVTPMRVAPADPSSGNLGFGFRITPTQPFDPRNADWSRFPARPVAQNLETDGPAWNGGLRNGDVFLTVNGRDALEVPGFFRDRTPGTRYAVRVQRGDRQVDLEIVVGPPVATAG